MLLTVLTIHELNLSGLKIEPTETVEVVNDYESEEVDATSDLKHELDTSGGPNLLEENDR